MCQAGISLGCQSRTDGTSLPAGEQPIDAQIRSVSVGPIELISHERRPPEWSRFAAAACLRALIGTDPAPSLTHASWQFVPDEVPKLVCAKCHSDVCSEESLIWCGGPRGAAIARCWRSAWRSDQPYPYPLIPPAGCLPACRREGYMGASTPAYLFRSAVRTGASACSRPAPQLCMIVWAAGAACGSRRAELPR